MSREQTQKELREKYIKEARTYVINHYRTAEAYIRRSKEPDPSPVQSSPSDIRFSDRSPNLEDEQVVSPLNTAYSNYIRTGRAEMLSRALSGMKTETFSDRLNRLVREKFLFSAIVYKRAQLDRRLYSKIISDKAYKPSKDTVIALAFALGLSETEANEFLASAGYALSTGSERDLMFSYFFSVGERNIILINEVLAALGQKILGK